MYCRGLRDAQGETSWCAGCKCGTVRVAQLTVVGFLLFSRAGRRAPSRVTAKMPEFRAKCRALVLACGVPQHGSRGLVFRAPVPRAQPNPPGAAGRMLHALCGLQLWGPNGGSLSADAICHIQPKLQFNLTRNLTSRALPFGRSEPNSPFDSPVQPLLPHDRTPCASTQAPNPTISSRSPLPASSVLPSALLSMR